MFDRLLLEAQFEWDKRPVKFVDSPSVPDGQESAFKKSKSNVKQARICKLIVSQLQQPAARPDSVNSSEKDVHCSSHPLRRST